MQKAKKLNNNGLSTLGDYRSSQYKMKIYSKKLNNKEFCRNKVVAEDYSKKNSCFIFQKNFFLVFFRKIFFLFFFFFQKQDFIRIL